MTGSFLDELEAVSRHLRAHATKELDVPGSGGRLVVRFRPPADPDTLTGVVAALKVQGAIDSERAKQMLVDCCDEILHRNGSPDPTPVDPDGGPLRFNGGDERWGDDIKTARDCVAKLYHLEQQPLAHVGHADVLVDWLQGLDAEIEARVDEAGKADGRKPSS